MFEKPTKKLRRRLWKAVKQKLKQEMRRRLEKSVWQKPTQA